MGESRVGGISVSPIARYFARRILSQPGIFGCEHEGLNGCLPRRPLDLGFRGRLDHRGSVPEGDQRLRADCVSRPIADSGDG